MKLADLSVDRVLLAFPTEAYRTVSLHAEFPDTPWKIVVRRVEAMVRDGLLDYGVSPGLPWLTPKGLDHRRPIAVS